MCLADSRQQTTVVLVVAYTVPKRFNPGRPGRSRFRQDRIYRLLCRNGSEGEPPELVFRNYGLTTIIASACRSNVTEVTRYARRWLWRHCVERACDRRRKRGAGSDSKWRPETETTRWFSRPERRRAPMQNRLAAILPRRSW